MNETSKIQLLGLWITKARVFTLNLIFVVIALVVILTILGSIIGGSKLADPEGKTLVFKPKGPIVEQISGIGSNPLDFILSGPPSPQVNVRDVLFTLRSVKDDQRIKNVVLQLDSISGTGQTVLYDVGQALKEIRDSGKKIIAVSDYFDESSYYLASFANEVIIHPDGGVNIDGYSRIRTYYKSFIDKLDVSVNLFRVGKYKSAMEPYIRDDMSEAAKEASRAYMDVLWSSWKKVVSENRGLKPVTIQNYADQIDAFTIKESGSRAKAAKAAGLVDKFLNRTDLRKYLVDIAGEDKEKKSFLQISTSEYFKVLKQEEETNKSKNKIAIIVASGSIVDGRQPAGMIGGDSTAEIIRKAHEDESVKALVLRVDSGGGSAFASEVIREELALAKKKGIKVIASMSNVAASGGYWISASADEIWASHDTITGSIGIFGFLPTFEKTLEKIGINTDGVSTTKVGGGINPTQKINPILARALQAQIEHGYERFIQLVADSRGMSIEEVDLIAQGRVWAGETAMNLGLVDNLGNLEDAIKRASELAKLDSNDFTTFYPTLPSGWRDQLLDQFFSKIMIFFFKDTPKNAVLKQSYKVLGDINSLNDPKGIYLKCLDCPLY